VIISSHNSKSHFEEFLLGHVEGLVQKSVRSRTACCHRGRIGSILFCVLSAVGTQISAVSSPLLVKGVTFYELAYSVSYTNRGVLDLTISGEIQTKIEGIREADARAIGEKTISQPRFLLRVGETSSWVISVGVYETEFTPRNSLNIRLEAIAFLRINGMERTLTANYQFTGP
jgi:hypothetical protein